MVAIAQGEVWWVDLAEPTGLGLGFRRPVLVVQGDALNRSRIATVVCVAMTSNLGWADAPGNVVLPSRTSGLPKDSVVKASQGVTLDKSCLAERIGKLSERELDTVLAGIDVVLGR